MLERNKGRFVMCQMCNKRFVGYSGSARFCVPCRSVRQRKFRTIFPWATVLHRIKIRCRRSEWYKKMNIQCFLTHKETKTLWIRDKADTMKRPSIDRVDNTKGYMFDNCRFIELEDNVNRRSLNTDVLIDKNKTLEAIVAKLKQQNGQLRNQIRTKFGRVLLEKDEEIARLKTDNEGLKDCLLARDCAIKEYKEENEKLRKGNCEHVAQGVLGSDCKLCELRVAEKGYPLWVKKAKKLQARLKRFEEYICIEHNYPSCPECAKEFSAMEKRAGDIKNLPYCPDFVDTMNNKEKKYTERDMGEAIRTAYFMHMEKASKTILGGSGEEGK